MMLYGKAIENPANPAAHVIFPVLIVAAAVASPVYFATMQSRRETWIAAAAVASPAYLEVSFVG